MKKCTKCLKFKCFEFFSKKHDTKDGYASRCKECLKSIHKIWRERNKELIREIERRNAAYRKEYKSRPEVIARRRELSKSPEKKSLRAARIRNKRVNDPRFSLHSRISCSINQSLRRVNGKSKGANWNTLLGYSTEQLRAHLEKQFLPGMGWHNICDWHIDHIIPVSNFKFTSANDDEFKRCWCISNLRPLWSKENINKSDKLLFLI